MLSDLDTELHWDSWTAGQAAIIMSHLAINSFNRCTSVSLIQSSLNVASIKSEGGHSLCRRKGQRLLMAAGSQLTGPLAKLGGIDTKPCAGLGLRDVYTVCMYCD